MGKKKLLEKRGKKRSSGVPGGEVFNLFFFVLDSNCMPSFFSSFFFFFFFFFYV